MSTAQLGKLASAQTRTSKTKKFFVPALALGELFQLEDMAQKTPAELDARAAALTGLGPDRAKQLAGYANLCSRGLDEDGEDLLSGAQARWLASDIPVAGPDDTVKFLIGAINSLRSNAFRKQRVAKRAFGDRAEPNPEAGTDPLDDVEARACAADDAVFAQQAYDALSDEPDVQILLCHLAEKTSRADIQKELGWDDHKYEAVQKRKIRAIARLMAVGKL